MVSVNTSNLGALQGMPDVSFDFGVSAELKRVFRAAASALTSQRAARQGYRQQATASIRGPGNLVFRTDGTWGTFTSDPAGAHIPLDGH